MILSHRFCFILLTDDSVSVPQILTLTFTEKAAEEMKGRIYEMLSRFDRQMQKVGDEALRNRIRKAREQFHRNRISTIHSFCANLLREYPVESGIDPGFAVIQGARQRRILEQAIETGVSSIWQADQDKLMPLLQAVGGRKNLLRAIRNQIDHPLTFHRVMETKERLFKTAGWERQVFREYCRVIKDNSLIPYLKGLRGVEDEKGQHEELLSLLEDWYNISEKDKDSFGLPELFRQIRRMVETGRPSIPKLSVTEGLKKISYVDLVEEFNPDLFSVVSPDYILGKQLDLFLMVAGICMEQYQKEKERINTLDFADLEARCHTFLTDLSKDRDLHGLKRIQQRFKYIMVDEFQDTNRDQWEIIRLLCSDIGKDRRQLLQPGKLFVVGDKRQAIYRFRGGDVTVFESVTEKIKAFNPERPEEMFWQNQEMNERLIGIDKGYPESLKKQTDAFDSLPESERKNIQNGDIYLPHNFRTDFCPIDFFNNTFEKIFGNKGAEKLRVYETAPRPITMPEVDKRSLEEKGSVTFYLTRISSSGRGKAETEAALIAEIIEAILGRHGKERFEYRAYPDIRYKIEKGQSAIGILFFAFSHIKAFESILREAGLPFKVHRGKGFYRCQEVMEMIQLLNYLFDEREQISLLSALRSPIFGLTDPEIFDLFYDRSVTVDQLLSSENLQVRSVGRQIESWRLLSDRLTLAELIRRVISDRRLTAVYSVHPNGMQRLANMEKLIEIARSFQSEGNGSLPEFVEYCLEMAEENEDEGEALVISGDERPICLMTIHAAKGLEFPMVIIPDLDRRLPSRPRTGKPVRLYSAEKGGQGGWHFREGEIPVWPVEVPELDFTKRYSPLGYLLMRRNRLEDMAENRRVFYVGCTRTRNHLILMGRMKKRLMEKDRLSLSSEDYRERATIMELLDDIYKFNLNYPPEEAELFESKGDLPSVVWRNPDSREFKGVRYKGKTLGQKDFGIYDDKVRELDLTEPIRSPSYYQLSFKTIRIFRKCAVRFYYSVILGFRVNGSRPWGSTIDTKFMEGAGYGKDDDPGYSSGEALLMGSLIHGYLERHHFGDPFDEDLFESLWGRLINDPGQDEDGLDKQAMAGLWGKALNHLKTTVDDERLIRLLKGQKNWSEVPFLFSISRGCEFRGVIDRLFRDRKTGLWAIIDWKSNDLKGKDPDHVVRENDYHLQLACYRWAAERILNEKVGDLYIYFTDRGHLLKASFEGYPEKIIEDMLKKIGDYETDRKNLDRDRREMRDMRECRICEYRGILCREGEILA